jgi:hypothetical protein
MSEGTQHAIHHHFIKIRHTELFRQNCHCQTSLKPRVEYNCFALKDLNQDTTA